MNCQEMEAIETFEEISKSVPTYGFHGASGSWLRYPPYCKLHLRLASSYGLTLLPLQEVE